MGCIVFSFLLLVFSGAVYPENRFSVGLEYELMDWCFNSVPRSRVYREKTIVICVCALQTTKENGWWPDYDNDEDYYDDKSKFSENFQKNIELCLKNKELREKYKTSPE